MTATPEPFIFYIVHYIMMMVSIIKGTDLGTLQNISTYKEIGCGYVLQIAGHISLRQKLLWWFWWMERNIHQNHFILCVMSYDNHYECLVGQQLCTIKNN